MDFGTGVSELMKRVKRFLLLRYSSGQSGFPDEIRLSGEVRGTKEELLRVAQSLASRGWPPNARTQLTKAADAAVLG